MNFNSFTLFTGVLASLTFIFSLLALVFNFSGKAETNLRSAKHYTRFIKDFSAMKNKDLVSEENFIHAKDNYTYIADNSPLIPDKVFLKCKQKLLIKIEISKVLDKCPWKSIKAIKRELNGN